MTHQHPRMYHAKPVKFLITLILVTTCLQLPEPCQCVWFQDILTNSTSSQIFSSRSLSQETVNVPEQKQEQQEQQVAITQQTVDQQIQEKTGQMPTSIDGFTIAGIRPSNIASLLNTVSETGFSYFNVHDQCRSRTACDVGYMLYKKLNFVHNWIIRASVRTLVDSSNIYAQSWNNGMMGKNCSVVFPLCHQSPLDSLMSFALLSS